ncbi:MAG TPA: trypsin-like peptidase domain-containing protein [Fimbriiglobus sp.]|jgi:serine protease Do|nr:trypsin-like peptidase domain-containing protein [Fimbriiglobus sp.]
MIRRWSLAAACLLVGALAATIVTGHIRGQQPVPEPPPVPRDLTSYRDVVKKVIPAVVSIEAKALADRKPPASAGRAPQLPPGLPEEHRRFFDAAEEPAPDLNLGFGSGVLIDSSGVVLTNFHVVEGADTVEVELHDGRKFPSKDIRRDAKTDLAVIKLTADKPLPFLELGDSDAAEVGDRVLAVGAPFGLTGSVTHGIVSAKSRRNLNLNQYEDFVQTDAAINPGNSGGPLIGLDGKVLGINAAIKTRSGGFQGVGLAVSSNLAKDVARQLMTTGVVRRGYLGVLVRELDDELAVRMGVAKGQGVVVSKVYADTPAAKAGLQVGDVITAIAGTPVRDANTLPRVVVKLPINQPSELSYVRDGKPISLPVTILEQPEEYGARQPQPLPQPQPVPAPVPRGFPGGARHVERAGLTVADLTPAAGFPKEARGVVIVGVDRGGAAAAAGLVRGQVVVKVDRTPVVSVAEFAAAVAAASPDRGALLHVLRPTGEVDFVLLRVK